MTKQLRESTAFAEDLDPLTYHPCPLLASEGTCTHVHIYTHRCTHIIKNKYPAPRAFLSWRLRRATWDTFWPPAVPGLQISPTILSSVSELELSGTSRSSGHPLTHSSFLGLPNLHLPSRPRGGCSWSSCNSRPLPPDVFTRGTCQYLPPTEPYTFLGFPRMNPFSGGDHDLGVGQHITQGPGCPDKYF